MAEAETEWVDYYHLLGLCNSINKTGKGPDSTQAEIKKAYRYQMKLHSPRKYTEGSEDWKKNNEEAQAINAANDVLKDPAKKAAYDKKWHKRNPWFRGQGSDEEANSNLPEIAVQWDPRDALSNLFYNIPKGEKRQAKLHITPKVGNGFLVEIKEPKSGWLRVISPKGRRDTVPFTAEIEIDTSDLVSGHGYEEELEFVLEDI